VGHQLVEGHHRGHGHDEHDEGEQGLHRHDPAAFYTAEEIAGMLDLEEWDDVVTETRDRDPEAAERTGNPVPDTVLVACRSAVR
jgi:hypothetical protein